MRGVSKVGPGGHPSRKQKKLISKNLYCVHEVTMAKPHSVIPSVVKDWSFYMKLVSAAAEVKATTLRQGTRTNSACLMRLRIWHPTQLSAGTPREKQLRKIAREARREFEAGRAVLPREKALQGRLVTITMDKVLLARGKMLRNKANGPADHQVSEILKCLATETVYEVPHWCDKRIEG